MSDVNWDSVAPKKAEQDEDSKGPMGTVVFIVLVVLGVILGGTYVNSLVLSNRVREIVIAGCEDPLTCAQDIQELQSACFSENVSYGIPSLGDFQTPPTSPRLGVASVDIEAYRACVSPKKAKTLAESEAK